MYDVNKFSSYYSSANKSQRCTPSVSLNGGVRRYWNFGVTPSRKLMWKGIRALRPYASQLYLKRSYRSGKVDVAGVHSPCMRWEWPVNVVFCATH